MHASHTWTMYSSDLNIAHSHTRTPANTNKTDDDVWCGGYVVLYHHCHHQQPEKYISLHISISAQQRICFIQNSKNKKKKRKKRWNKRQKRRRGTDEWVPRTYVRRVALKWNWKRLGNILSHRITVLVNLYAFPCASETVSFGKRSTTIWAKAFFRFWTPYMIYMCRVLRCCTLSLSHHKSYLHKPITITCSPLQ